MTRKPTPDLLSNILNANMQSADTQSADSPRDDEQIPETVKRHDGKTLHRHDVKDVKHQNSKTAKQQKTKAAQDEVSETPTNTESAQAGKIKATFYLSPELIENIDHSRLQLRRMTDPARRGAISKSLLIETALNLALQELETQQENSKLAKQVTAVLGNAR